MPLNIGLVGCRGIGKTHAEAHAGNELSKLIAVCDVIKERADELAEKHKVKAYYDFSDMLEGEPEIEAVDVTTGGNENGSWHFEPVMQALEAGKHVLVEKPISNTVEEARLMVKTANEKDLYLGCNLNHYFTIPAEMADQHISDGKIGEMIYCLHRMGFPGGDNTYEVPGGPNSKGFPYFHVKAFLAHPFSIMRHFCGDITHVQAFMDQPSIRRKSSDLMRSINSIHVRFRSGAVGYLFSQRGDATMGLGGWWSVEVGGTCGTFCIENCVEKFSYYPTPGSEGAAKPEKVSVGSAPPPEVHNTGITDFGTTFPRRIHAFLEDVTKGVPKHQLRASGRDALATLEYTFAAIESYEQGGILVRPAALPPIKRDPRDEA